MSSEDWKTLSPLPSKSLFPLLEAQDSCWLECLLSNLLQSQIFKTILPEPLNYFPILAAFIHVSVNYIKLFLYDITIQLIDKIVFLKRIIYKVQCILWVNSSLLSFYFESINHDQKIGII